MKSGIPDNRISRKRKLFFLRILAIFIILAGCWLFATNIIDYTAGYFAAKSDTSENNYDELQPDLNILTSAKEEEALLQNNDDDTLMNLKKEKQAVSDKEEAEPVLYPERPENGDKIGELSIPKIDVTLPIYEGTDKDELKKGVGHFTDSVLPGENDNSVLSGHRDTVFRKLGEVGEGDFLIVKTSAGEFKYKVYKVRIVDKDDRTVIVPKPRATLTVTTCYPFEYIGSAPQRYILVAYLDTKTLNEK